MKQYVLSIDQGTTSSRAIIFDQDSNIISKSQKEFPQYYPHPSWVEQDAEEIYQSVLDVVEGALKEAKLKIQDIQAIGITNQRETTVLWERATGKPVYPAICWQSRQSQDICDELKNNHYEPVFKKKTGLVIDPYFSGTKIKWIFDHVDGLRERARNGEILFGTIDTFLMYRLSEGTIHATDYSNASRTLLFNIYDLKFDEELLHILDIPHEILPEVKPSSYVYGVASALGTNVKIAGVAGDQQAALFGQTCFKEGEVKSTYGTGGFMLMNTGKKIVNSQMGLLTTIAWGLDNKVTYALEGSIFIAGSAVQWIRDNLGLIHKSSESEALATSISSNEGVYFVPAFVGLGTPHWDTQVRGTFLGLTRGTNKAHFARAVLEAICYQVKEVLDVMEIDSNLKMKHIRVDGGATVNNFLLQFQSDILGIDVIRPQVTETTALGVAYLAGLAVGVWSGLEDICTHHTIDKHFYPKMKPEESIRYFNNYKRAVAAAKSFKAK